MQIKMYKSYMSLPDDHEPITTDWVFANFPSIGRQYSARQRKDCNSLVWQNRFERFTLFEQPVPQLKTRGSVRMLLFVLYGIVDLNNTANYCRSCGKLQ